MNVRAETDTGLTSGDLEALLHPAEFYVCVRHVGHVTHMRSRLSVVD